MINTSETLRGVERFKAKEARDTLPQNQLDPVRVEQMFTQRKEKLFSIKGDITPVLYEAIRAKVEYENNFLLGVIETDTKMSETRKRLNKTLKAEYFVQKSLDANII